MKRRKFIIGSLFASIGVALGIYTFKPSGSIFSLSEEEYDSFIRALGNAVIPEDDSGPGAGTSDLTRYTKVLIESYFSKRERETFVTGAYDLYEAAKDDYGQIFPELSSAEQISMLESLEKDVPENYLMRKIKEKIFGRPFIHIAKQLVGEAYCCSEVGAKRFLTYDPIPGKYITGIKIDSSTSSWQEN